MKKNVKVFLFLVILLFVVSGCSTLNVSAPPINLKVSESTEIPITIENANGFVNSAEFTNLKIANLIDTKGVVSIDITKSSILQSNLKAGQSTTAKIYLTGEQYGDTVATLEIVYDGGSKKIQLPITVSKPSLSIFLQDYSGGEKKISRNENLYVIVTNQDDVTYNYAKILISSDYSHTNFNPSPSGNYNFTKKGQNLEINTQVQPGTLKLPFVIVTSKESGLNKQPFSFSITLFWSIDGNNYKQIDKKDINVNID